MKYLFIIIFDIIVFLIKIFCIVASTIIFVLENIFLVIWHLDFKHFARWKSILHLFLEEIPLNKNEHEA